MITVIEFVRTVTVQSHPTHQKPVQVEVQRDEVDLLGQKSFEINRTTGIQGNRLVTKESQATVRVEVEVQQYIHANSVEANILK
jgi:hypothetical protein